MDTPITPVEEKCEHILWHYSVF